MKGPVIGCLAIVVLGTLSACGRSPSSFKSAKATSTETAAELPADYFASTSECIKGWNSVLSEWRQATGGFAESLQGTQDRIRADTNTRFSSFVRASWSRVVPTSEPFGSWPISAAQYRELLETLEYDQLQLPARCESIDMLQSGLWSELVRTAPTKDPTLRDMPQQLPRESPAIPQWVTYWLLASEAKR